jgi:hypothetical protein
VAWYRFEEGGTNYSLATNIVDSGSNGLHGVASPLEVLRYAPVGTGYPASGTSALAFFGSGVATLPNPAGIDLEQAFTIELLLRPFEDVPDPTQWHTILSKRATDDPQSDGILNIEYQPMSREIRVYYRLRDANGAFTGTDPRGILVRSPNRWNHVVLKFSHYHDGSYANYETTIMVDGSVGTYSSMAADVHADLGTGPFQLGGGFYGLVDELRISNAALDYTNLLVTFPPHGLAATILPKVDITFPTYRWNYYEVQWTSDVNSEVWNILETGIDGTGFPITVSDPGGFGQNRFYRIHEYD